MKQKKNTIINIILIFISVCIISCFCIYQNNLVNLLNSIHTLNSFWLLISLICIITYWFIDAQIIQAFTKDIYYDEFSFKMSLKTTMVGQYFSSISPLGIAGQPMQVVSMTRNGITSGIAMLVLVRKFLMYQTVLTFYSLFIIVFNFNFFNNLIPGFITLAIIGLICQSTLVVLLALFSINKTFTSKLIHSFFFLLYKFHVIKKPEENKKKVEQQLSSYLKYNKSMNRNLKLNIKLYLLTFLQLMCIFSIPFFIYKSFGYTGFPYLSMLSAQAFVTMISSYTPLPGGSGTTEGSFIVIFQKFFDSENINQAMLLWRFITYYLSIIVGAFFVKFASKAEKLSLSLNEKQELPI